jgi:hypothetical protein
MEPRPELVSGSIGDFRPSHWDASAGQEDGCIFVLVFEIRVVLGRTFLLLLLIGYILP